MALNLNIPQPEITKPKIMIFGVGGAGGNAINNMIRSNLEGVEFVAANTDAQALANSLAENKIQLGVAVTRGLGAGSFPDRGRAAAEENLAEIESLLEGSNMVFIAAGMGGGTGTGAAPVIAKLAKERDILTVGVVTKPFHFEGKYRMETATKGIDELKKHVDTLIIIPNQNLFRVANEHTTFESAFKMADDVLHAGVRGITDLITMPGLVNLDFADIRTIMTKMGKAMMGTGEAEGENRAVEACEAAISNPLLDDISIKGAKGVLVNMTGGPDMTLFEADLAVNTIKREVDQNANIIFGSAFNEDMKGRIRISVVATGIDEEEYRQDSFKISDMDEPSKFRASLDKNDNKKHGVKESISNTRKTFFDPGKAAEPANQEFEEISESNFATKKSYSKEENINYGKAENSKSKKHEEDSSFTQISFFGNDDEEEKTQTHLAQKSHDDDDYNDDIYEEETIVKPAKSSSHKVSGKGSISTKKEVKKENNSGFSLFGFMNSSKNKTENHAVPSNKKPTKNIEDEDEFELESSSESIKQKHKITQEKSQEAMKKKQEFFGGTVFDDEKENEENQKMDDDVINVPAFFRRKKHN